MTNELVIRALRGIPLVHPGDDLASIALLALKTEGLTIRDGDCLVIAQKIVSKSEARIRFLHDVEVTGEANHLAQITGKDPRFVQLVLGESREVLRARPGLLIVEHRLGFICANAGIDHSNVSEINGADDAYLLLPEDPSGSAERIRVRIEEETRQKIGVLVIDSFGRAWRNGTVGTVIGLSGVPGVVDQRGCHDLFGYELRATFVAAADSLAAAASLMMGEADEGTPIAHVRGFPYALRPGSLQEILRVKEQDLFR